MRVLVTGGAGYIGSVVVRELLKQKHEVFVIDDLSNGHRKALPTGRGWKTNRWRWRNRKEDADGYFRDMSIHTLGMSYYTEWPDTEIEVVVHLAASASVAESVEHPIAYWRFNVYETMCLLESMKHTLKCNKLVFASTWQAANPMNPYASTKRACEMMIQDSGIPAHILRLSNVAGAAHGCGEDHNPETHLIPSVLRAARDGTTAPIYGTKWGTRDGTCVRDYIHVEDVAKAIVRCVEGEVVVKRPMTLKSGMSYSVKEVINACVRITGKAIVTGDCSPRSGDTQDVFDDTVRFTLPWVPLTLEDMIRSQWEWMRSHPNGYNDRI